MLQCSDDVLRVGSFLRDVKDFLRDAGEVNYVNQKQDGDWYILAGPATQAALSLSRAEAQESESLGWYNRVSVHQRRPCSCVCGKVDCTQGTGNRYFSRIGSGFGLDPPGVATAARLLLVVTAPTASYSASGGPYGLCLLNTTNHRSICWTTACVL